MTSSEPTLDRPALRRRLLAAHQAWCASPEGEAAQGQLEQRLLDVLAQLEPDVLGVYWPMKGEFNPRTLALRAQAQWDCRLALPFAQREPVAMHFRPWDGGELSSVDECGLPSPAGKPVVPDVVLVPCVGFTPEGFRLGYGGGYFDRYLAAHPGVTVIGVAWEQARLSAVELAPQAHDLPLMAVVTEVQVWSPD